MSGVEPPGGTTPPDPPDVEPTSAAGPPDASGVTRPSGTAPPDPSGEPSPGETPPPDHPGEPSPGGTAPPDPTEQLAARFTERFGDQARPDISHGQLTVEVPTSAWLDALTFARDQVGCIFFDWLTGVDELEEGFSVVAHVWAPAGKQHVLLRTRVSRDNPALPSATAVFRGASWHERETYEMFGVEFTGHPNLVPLLLPDGFEGHPLRKEFVLAARAAKTWPGAKEPGESDHDTAAPSRRRMLPPGVPDPQAWGPRPPGSPEPATEPPAGSGPESRPGAESRPGRGRGADA